MMKKLITKPHLFFFGLIPVIFLLELINKNEIITTNVKTTYINIELKYLNYFFTILFTVIGLSYFFLYQKKKKIKKQLTFFHITLQTIAFLLFYTKNQWNWIGDNSLYSKFNIPIDNSNSVILISILLFMLATFFYVLNFFLSLFSKSK